MKTKDPNFLEAVLQGGEVAMDTLIDNEAIRSIPVIGIAFKVAKGVRDVRSRILIAKIMRFVNEPALQSPRVKQKLKAKALSALRKRKRSGNHYFLYLNA